MKPRKIFSAALACAIATAAVAASAATPKRVLVFSRCEGYKHKASIAACKEKMSAEAKKGAFDVEFSNDYAAFRIENLVKYDALVLNNTTHLKTKDNPHVAPAILSFVRWGGGLCVIHAGADCFYDAPECAHLVGGRFDGHPWTANGTWAFKVEDRESPLTASFKVFADGRFKRRDEIYQMASPFFDRSKLHVLVSLDMDDPATANANVKRQKRTDRDYAVSWIRSYGKGRVFYTSFAHDRLAWDSDDTRAHIFAGLAYTLGTLKADDTPSCAADCGKEKNKCCPFHVPTLQECATAVLDKACAGADACKREECLNRLSAALGLAVERGEAKEAAAVARRVFASKRLPAPLRATAARVLLAADPSILKTVLSDHAKTVRESAFGRGLAIPPQSFAKELPGATRELKCAIVAHLAQVGAKCCKNAVIEATADPDEEVAAAATVALGVLGGVDDIELLCRLSRNGGAVGAAAKDSLSEIPGAGDRIFDLAASDKSILSIAAKRAETKFIPRWKAFIESSDPAVRKSAWRAFGKMTSDATDASMFKWFAAVGEEEASVAAGVVWNALKARPADVRTAQIVDLWKKGSPAARAEAEDLLVRANGVDALESWSALAKDAVHGKAAKAAYVALAKKIVSGEVSARTPQKGNWRGEASRSVKKDPPHKAYDGNPDTRWTSGQNPKGVWYSLDMGDSVFVDSVTLNTEKSSRDTPAGCNVYVSDDGKSWQGPVATCDDKSTRSTTFKVGRVTRHLKFEALASRPGLHWSIHEIDIKAKIDPARVEQIKKTAAEFEKEAE